MDKRIKVTYIIDSLDSTRGGTENQLLKLIHGLDKKRFQLELINFKNLQWMVENAPLLPCYFKLFEFTRFYHPGSYLNLIKCILFLRHSKPDIVHTFFPVGNILGVLAAKLAGVRTIVSSRRDYGEWMNGPYLFSTKIANRFVKRILANSHEVKALTEKKENVKGEKVEVILNGINPDKFRDVKRDDDLKKRLGIPDQDKVIGIVANFRPMKHHYTFIKAASEILKTRDDIKFLLVGDGPLKEEMERLGASLNISQNLIFAGSHEDVTSHLSITDVGVNCSEGEGLSNAVMEYMITGVPCVISNAGGNPDLIEHEVSGYLFPLDDFKTLASLALNLLDDVETQNRFKANARKKIENEMRLDVILAKYEGFYREILNA